MKLRFRLFEESIRYLLESQEGGSIVFAVACVEYVDQSVRVPGRLTKTRPSYSLDLVVEYSTIFMEEIAYAEHLKHRMKETSPAFRGSRLEDACFLACLNSTRLGTEAYFQYWKCNGTKFTKRDLRQTVPMCNQIDMQSI